MPAGTTTIAIPAGSISYTIQDFIDSINGLVPGVTAFLDANGQVQIQPTDPASTIAVANPVPALTSGLGQVFGGTPIALPPVGAAVVGASPFDPTNNTAGYPALLNDPPTNPQGWWVFEYNAGGTIQQGYVNFNPDGTINGVPNADG